MSKHSMMTGAAVSGTDTASAAAVAASLTEEYDDAPPSYAEAIGEASSELHHPRPVSEVTSAGGGGGTGGDGRTSGVGRPSEIPCAANKFGVASGFQHRMSMDIQASSPYDPHERQRPLQRPSSGRRHVKAPAREWLTVLLGTEESRSSVKSFTHTYDADGRHILVSPAGPKFVIGEFSTPSLAELRIKSSHSFPETVVTRIRISHVATEDVMELHGRAENINAVFQVASQFNCLEFRDEYTIPENGIWMYIQDQTQGPSCSIAAAPATFFRTYLANVNGQVGQTEFNQINTLKDLCNIMKDPVSGESYISVKNGYTKATPQSLKKAKEFINSRDRDDVMGLLRVGLHSGVQVTCIGREWHSKSEMDVIQIDDKKQVVTQVLCSAVSCAYSQMPRRDWEAIAKLVLDGTYEATLLAAAENARVTGCKKVFLTFIGGGAFGNSSKWIADAIRRALRRCRHLDLDVVFVHFRAVDPNMKKQIDEVF